MAAPISGLVGSEADQRAGRCANQGAEYAVLVAPLSIAACCGVPLPIRCEAYCWQVASSAWNCSKVLPSAGSAMTLGPDGGAMARAAEHERRDQESNGCCRVMHGFHPDAGSTMRQVPLDCKVCF